MILSQYNISSSPFTHKIDLHSFHVPNSTHTQPTPSDIPSPEHLNQRLASRIPNGSRFTATIPSHDFQSFVTDHHKRWLTQQPTPRLPAFSPDCQVDPESDFVLFPGSTDLHQACGPTGWAQVASPVIPSLEPVAALHGHPQKDKGQHSALLQTSSASASSVQSARANNTVHDTGSRVSSTSASHLNFLSQRPRFYASSAPSSSVNLRTRPPVPLFHKSTGNMNFQTLSDSTQPLPEGKIATSKPLAVSSLIGSDSGISPGFYDSMSNFDPITVDFPLMTSFDNMDDFGMQTSAAPFSSVQQRTSASVSTSVHTISPKDLLLDNMSAPPSTTVTNLTTPGTTYMESPYIVNSTNPSPILSTENPGDRNWTSLFDDVPQPESDKVNERSPVLNTHVAPRMSRDGSSGQPSSRGSQKAAHSSANGVSAKRRDKPLPAITIDDPNDIVAVKRARNTMAARKSRQKRMERTEELENLVAELRQDRDNWKQIALSLGHPDHPGQ